MGRPATLVAWRRDQKIHQSLARSSDLFSWLQKAAKERPPLWVQCMFHALSSFFYLTHHTVRRISDEADEQLLPAFPFRLWRITPKKRGEGQKLDEKIYRRPQTFVIVIINNLPPFCTSLTSSSYSATPRPTFSLQSISPASVLPSTTIQS